MIPTPTAVELLEAGGWRDVPEAQILAHASDGAFAAALVDCLGQDGANPQASTVEGYVFEDGRWVFAFHFGPVSDLGPGGGTYLDRWNYEFGRSGTGDGEWWMVVAEEPPTGS